MTAAHVSTTHRVHNLIHSSQSADAWLDPVVRVGYITKGVVYLLLGGLAVAAAIGVGGKVSGSEGVLQTLAGQPYGRVLLTAVAVGLAAYAIWRLVQGLWDPESSDSGVKHAGKRVFYGISGVAHLLLAYTALDMAWIGGGGSGASKQSALQWLLSATWGQWLVSLVGTAIGVFAVLQLRHVVGAKFMERLDTAEMSAQQRVWVERLGRVGYCARAIVFGMIASMVVYAAAYASPSQAKSTGGALREISSQAYGHVMLALIATGLAIYGLLQFFKARWRIVSV